MGATAQVDEGIRVAVVADLAIASHLVGQLVGRLVACIGIGGHGHRLDDLPLVGVVGEELQAFGRRHLVALERLVCLDDLPHSVLDSLKVVIADGGPFGQVKVVVEAVLNGRADGVGGTGVHLQYRLGQHMCSGVAQRFQPSIAVGGDDGHLLTVGQRNAQVHFCIVDGGDEGSFGQTGADISGQIPRGCAGRKCSRAAVGENDADFSHGSTN